MQDLRSLMVEDNLIQTLDVGTFFGLDDLEVLDLSRNRIGVLPQQVFRDLVQLKVREHICFFGNNILFWGNSCRHESRAFSSWAKPLNWKTVFTLDFEKPMPPNGRELHYRLDEGRYEFQRVVICKSLAMELEVRPRVKLVHIAHCLQLRLEIVPAVSE